MFKVSGKRYSSWKNSIEINIIFFPIILFPEPYLVHYTYILEVPLKVLLELEKQKLQKI